MFHPLACFYSPVSHAPSVQVSPRPPPPSQQTLNLLLSRGSQIFVGPCPQVSGTQQGVLISLTPRGHAGGRPQLSFDEPVEF